MPLADEGMPVAQLQPVRPVTVFQAVYDQLFALLTSDVYSPGARLPSERELAEQLRVSRPSVREALKALRVLGLIEVRGRSTYVKSQQAGSEAGPPAITLPLAEIELLEIHEFREAVEGHIAELAAERAAAHDTAALERVLAVMQEEFSRDVEAFLAADREFHRTLARAAANRLLLAAHTQIYEQALLQPRLQSASRHSAAVAGALERMLEAHRQMLEAVHQRDGAKARRLMRAHLAQLRQDIIVGAFAPEAEATGAVP